MEEENKVSKENVSEVVEKAKHFDKKRLIKFSIIIIVTVILIFLIISLLLYLINPSSSKIIKRMNVEDIAKTLECTSINDSLIGKENQYTSKTQFASSSISKKSFKGGSVEVFNNSVDAKNRKEYLENIREEFVNTFTENYYGKSNVSKAYEEFGIYNVYQNKSTLLLLNYNMTDSNINTYTMRYNDVISKCIYIERKQNTNTNVENLEKAKVDIQKYKEKFEKSLNDDINDFEKKVIELDGTLAETALSTCKVKLQDYNYEFYREKYNTLNEKIISIETKIESLLTGLDNLEKRINTLSNTLNENDFNECKNELENYNYARFSEKYNELKEKLADIEKKITAKKEEASFKKSCKSMTFETLSRNPIYDNVVLTGKVVQVIESYGTVQALRVDITKVTSKYLAPYYKDTVYVDCILLVNKLSTRILEDDIITIYGTASGFRSYTSVLGSTITLPEINAKYIETN